MPQGSSSSISGIFDSLLLGNTLASAKVTDAGKGPFSSRNWVVQAADSLSKMASNI
jgi:hypothetical protein